MGDKQENQSLRVGTRTSALARWQAEWVAERLVRLGHKVELVPIVTEGDRNRQAKIGSIGTQNVFTKEIQQALRGGRIDLAVHSLKDLSTAQVRGLRLSAVPSRGAVGDALVLLRGSGINSLAAGAIIGTGSPRRRAQLLHVRPDLSVRDIRGNIDSRLKKLENGSYDAIVLAEAGLRRLGLESYIGEIMPTEIMLPAVGQGALGIETRADDQRTHAAVAPLDDAETHTAVIAERAMLAALQGGCQASIAAWSRWENGRLRLSGRVLSPDGRRRIDAEHAAASRQDPAELGRGVAAELSAMGAVELLSEVKH